MNVHQSFNKKISNYLDRELHTWRVVSPVLMLIKICARGVRGHPPPPNKNDKKVRSGAF